MSKATGATLDALMTLSFTACTGCAFMDCWLFDEEVREWAALHESWLELGTYSPLLVGCTYCLVAFLTGFSVAMRKDIKRHE